jgi:predicted Rossmann fold flavoprotein
MSLPSSTNVAIVGAGAAGLAAAIFTRRQHPAPGVLLLDGARKPGAKILVSGGARCNVTNAVVSDADFWGGRASIVRRILKALPVERTVEFFADLGVALHEEAGGKLFPDSNRARDVLDALLRGVHEAGATLVTDARVHAVRREGAAFLLETSAGPVRADVVVLATGGRALPKTGSDGMGYRLAQALGHTLIADTPALAPLLLASGTPESIHEQLSGIAIDGEIAVWIDGAVACRLRGALLWTHFGVSGPLALNVSRHWARATLERRAVRLTLSLYPGEPFEAIDARWIRAAAERPASTLKSALASHLPEALALAILRVLQLPSTRELASLTRDDRRRLVHAVTAWTLPVIDTRGYTFAEVTAGGVPLTEIDPSTMESRVCPGLFLTGEILDVDGRIGGFNFQWAWSSAFAAARGISRRIADTSVR